MYASSLSIVGEITGSYFPLTFLYSRPMSIIHNHIVIGPNASVMQLPLPVLIPVNNNVGLRLQTFLAVYEMRPQHFNRPMQCKARYCDCTSSVRPSEALVGQDHIGWKSWLLTARTIRPANTFALRKAIHLLY